MQTTGPMYQIFQGEYVILNYIDLTGRGFFVVFVLTSSVKGGGGYRF